MSSLTPKAKMQAANALFNACEAGKGWAGCAQYCAPNATFACQAVDLLPGQPPVTECKTVEAYAQWMRAIVADFGDKATVEVNAAALDEERSVAVFFATFGGFSHYVYKMHINEEGKCDDMVKVWNDAFAAKVISGAPTAATT